MGKADESLRNSRLVFYKEDIERIAKILITFLKNANARCVLMVDKDGHLVTDAANGQVALIDIWLEPVN